MANLGAQTQFSDIGTGEEIQMAPNVEEKYEKYFGYLARCEGSFCTTTLKISNFGSKLDENTEIDSQNL